jgi:hypothetical protein
MLRSCTAKLNRVENGKSTKYTLNPFSQGTPLGAAHAQALAQVSWDCLGPDPFCIPSHPVRPSYPPFQVTSLSNSPNHHHRHLGRKSWVESWAAWRLMGAWPTKLTMPLVDGANHQYTSAGCRHRCCCSKPRASQTLAIPVPLSNRAI